MRVAYHLDLFFGLLDLELRAPEPQVLEFRRENGVDAVDGAEVVDVVDGLVDDAFLFVFLDLRFGLLLLELDRSVEFALGLADLDLLAELCAVVLAQLSVVVVEALLELDFFLLAFILDHGHEELALLFAELGDFDGGDGLVFIVEQHFVGLAVLVVDSDLLDALEVDLHELDQVFFLDLLLVLAFALVSRLALVVRLAVFGLGSSACVLAACLRVFAACLDFVELALGDLFDSALASDLFVDEVELEDVGFFEVLLFLRLDFFFDC